MMVRYAEMPEANAVIGVRYDATELMQGVSEVLCYGTAVVDGLRSRVRAGVHFTA